MFGMSSGKEGFNAHTAPAHDYNVIRTKEDDWKDGNWNEKTVEEKNKQLEMENRNSCC